MSEHDIIKIPITIGGAIIALSFIGSFISDSGTFWGAAIGAVAGGWLCVADIRRGKE